MQSRWSRPSYLSLVRNTDWMQPVMENARSPAANLAGNFVTSNGNGQYVKQGPGPDLSPQQCFSHCRRNGNRACARSLTFPIAVKTGRHGGSLPGASSNNRIITV